MDNTIGVSGEPQGPTHPLPCVPYQGTGEAMDNTIGVSGEPQGPTHPLPSVREFYLLSVLMDKSCNPGSTLLSLYWGGGGGGGPESTS
jgi:hypothetical protein